MTDSDNINIRLVPTFVMGIPEEDPIHHTESGSFNLTSTLIPLDMNKPMKDVNSGVTIDPNIPMFQVLVYLFWNGVVAQKHTLIITDEDSNHHDCFDLEEAIQHSQTVHNSFGTYMSGLSTVFPSFRAIGWSFVPHAEVIAIQMYEQRAINIAMTQDAFDFTNMAEWDMFFTALGEWEGDDDEFDNAVDPQLGTTDWIPLVDKSAVDSMTEFDVNLNSNVIEFLDQLEKGLDDDETDGNE